MFACGAPPPEEAPAGESDRVVALYAALSRAFERPRDGEPGARPPVWRLLAGAPRARVDALLDAFPELAVRLTEWWAHAEDLRALLAAASPAARARQMRAGAHLLLRCAVDGGAGEKAALVLGAYGGDERLLRAGLAAEGCEAVSAALRSCSADLRAAVLGRCSPGMVQRGLARGSHGALRSVACAKSDDAAELCKLLALYPSPAALVEALAARGHGALRSASRAGNGAAVEALLRAYDACGAGLLDAALAARGAEALRCACAAGHAAAALALLGRASDAAAAAVAPSLLSTAEGEHALPADGPLSPALLRREGLWRGGGAGAAARLLSPAGRAALLMPLLLALWRLPVRAPLLEHLRARPWLLYAPRADGEPPEQGAAPAATGGGKGGGGVPDLAVLALNDAWTINNSEHFTILERARPPPSGRRRATGSPCRRRRRRRRRRRACRRGSWPTPGPSRRAPSRRGRPAAAWACWAGRPGSQRPP
jgi:hypothetical protein